MDKLQVVHDSEAAPDLLQSGLRCKCHLLHLNHSSLGTALRALLYGASELGQLQHVLRIYLTAPTSPFDFGVRLLQHWVPMHNERITFYSYNTMHVLESKTWLCRLLEFDETLLVGDGTTLYHNCKLIRLQTSDG